MKIVFVSDSIYPYNKGGKEKRLYDISTKLSKQGHDVHIYCMKWWKEKKSHIIENTVHLHSISPLYPLYSGDRRSIKQGILFGLSCLKLIKEKWDVIDVDHMPFFPIIFMKIVCILKRKKMIGTWHEVWGQKYWLKYLGWKGYIAYFIEKISIPLPDRIISVTPLTTARLKNLFGRKNGIKTILTGIDLAEINKVKPSTITSDIIYAGRLLSHKNVDLIIKAVHILKDKKKFVRCVIVGNGPEETILKDLVKKLNVSDLVTFHDFFPKHTQVLSLFKSAKIFVFPSEREGFGLVAMEANACGIPVITIDAPDNNTKALINKKNGVICRKDSRIISQVIQTVLKSYDKDVAIECSNTAKKYDIESLLKHFETFYLSQ